jgi:lysophospholipase-3
MQRSFTSSAFLFPSSNVWKEDESLAVTADRNYTIKDIPAFFKDIDYEIGYEQYKMASPGLITEPPEGLTVHCIYGHNVETPELLTWAKGYFPDYQPTVTFGDGDGTVNRKSLEVCKKWQNKSAAGLVISI